MADLSKIVDGNGTSYEILDNNAVHKTGDETISGDKTFNNSIHVDGNVTVKSGQSLFFKNRTTGYSTRINGNVPDDQTADYVVTVPNKNGTIALTSEINKFPTTFAQPPSDWGHDFNNLVPATGNTQDFTMYYIGDFTDGLNTPNGDGAGTGYLEVRKCYGSLLIQTFYPRDLGGGASGSKTNMMFYRYKNNTWSPWRKMTLGTKEINNSVTGRVYTNVTPAGKDGESYYLPYEFVDISATECRKAIGGSRKGYLTLRSAAGKSANIMANENATGETTATLPATTGTLALDQGIYYQANGSYPYRKALSYVIEKDAVQDYGESLYFKLNTTQMYYNKNIHFNILAGWDNSTGEVYVTNYGRVGAFKVEANSYNGTQFTGICQKNGGTDIYYIRVDKPAFTSRTSETLYVWTDVPSSGQTLELVTEDDATYETIVGYPYLGTHQVGGITTGTARGDFASETYKRGILGSLYPAGNNVDSIGSQGWPWKDAYITTVHGTADQVKDETGTLDGRRIATIDNNGNIKSNANIRLWKDDANGAIIMLGKQDGNASTTASSSNRGTIRFGNNKGILNVLEPNDATTGRTNNYLPARSGTLALDSEVVHTTGNETISGTKTFSNATLFNNDVKLIKNYCIYWRNNTSGKNTKLYALPDDGATADVNLQLPKTSGMLALTSDNLPGLSASAVYGYKVTKEKSKTIYDNLNFVIHESYGTANKDHYISIRWQGGYQLDGTENRSVRRLVIADNGNGEHRFRKLRAYVSEDETNYYCYLLWLNEDLTTNITNFSSVTFTNTTDEVRGWVSKVGALQTLTSLTATTYYQDYTAAVNEKVVHNTGNETVAGEKTFTSDAYFNNKVRIAAGKSIVFNPSDATKGKHQLMADNTTSAENYNLTLPNKSGTLAIDSEVVHNTGNETIAGSKTFSGTLTVSADWCGVKNLTVEAEKAIYFRRFVGSAAGVDLLKSSVRAGTDTSTHTIYLPSSGGTLALASEIPDATNLVHKTLTETITGAKTFTGDTVFDGDTTLCNTRLVTNMMIDSGQCIGWRNLNTRMGVILKASISSSVDDIYEINVPLANGTLALTSDFPEVSTGDLDIILNNLTV